MRKITVCVLLVVCFATFFVNNGVLLPDIMESRNIITAREMVYDGHWIVPTMNGDLRLEKPPLPTWLAAVAEMASPDDIVLQRVMAGLAAVMLVFFFYRFSEKILKVNALVATLLLCSCYNIILMGRTASWDIYCHAFMMGGIYCMARAMTLPRCSVWRFCAAGLFVGLSLMSKGPVSLYALFLPFLLAFLPVCRPQMGGKAGGVALMALVAIVVGTWWYAYIYAFHAGELTYVVNKETGAWVGHNVRPWYYYWKFFLETGVWSLLLLTALLLPAFKADCRRRGYMFSIAWTLCVLVLLSLLPEKKSRYLLPLLIPASYTMTFLIERWQAVLANASTSETSRGGRLCADKWLFRINVWLIAATVVALSVAAYMFVYAKGWAPLWAYVAFTVSCVLFALYLIYTSVALRPRMMVYGVAALFVMAEAFALPYVRGIIVNQERKSIALTRQDKRLAPLDFYHSAGDPLRIEMVYAAHKNIRPLDFSDKAAVLPKLPCAVLTHKRVGEELPATLWNDIDTTYIDRYDDNRYPEGHRRHSDMFVYNITVLTEKK